MRNYNNFRFFCCIKKYIVGKILSILVVSESDHFLMEHLNLVLIKPSCYLDYSHLQFFSWVILIEVFM